MAVERIMAASGGMNSDASEDYLARDESAFSSNLLSRQGKLVMRGPMRRKIDVMGTTERVRGAMFYGRQNAAILITYENTFVGPAVRGAHKPTATLIQTGPFLVTTMDLSLISTDRTPFDYRSLMLGNYCYAMAGTSVAPGGSIIRWDGSSSPPVQCAGPGEGRHFTAHLQRLFVIDKTSTLFWTDPVAGATPDLTVAASWQDDVSGLANQLVVGNGDSDYPIGVASIGSKLVIFKRESIWILLGDTPASFTLRQVSSRLGCVDAQSIVEHEGMCYFMSEDGVYSFDGVDLKNVSFGRVRDRQLQALQGAGVPIDLTDAATSRPGFARMMHVRDGVLLMVVATQAPQTAATITFSGLYDTRRNAWTLFDSDALSSSDSLSYFISTSSSSYYQNALLGWDGRDVVYLDEIVTPETSAEADKGKDTLTATTHINAALHSRLVRLASPGFLARVRRLMIDYKFVLDGAAAETAAGWYVSIYDGSGTLLLAEQQLTTQVDPPAQLGRKRAVLDCNVEASDLQVRIEWRGSGTPPAIATAELYDITVEFEPAQQRASY